MVIRALGLDEDINNNNEETSRSFNDLVEVDSVRVSHVIKANELNIINGYPDNTFGPNNNATRAEAFVMILRTLTHLKE